MRADLRESRVCRALYVSFVAVVSLVAGSRTSDAQTLTNPGPIAAGAPLPSPSVEPPPASTATGPVTLAEVVSLSKAGLSDDVIAGLIRQRGGVSNLSVEQLVYLRQQGVSNEAIRSLQNAGSAPKLATTTTATTTSQPVAAAPAPAPAPTATIAPAPAVTTYQIQPQPTVVVQPAPVVVRPYPYYWDPYCHHHWHSYPSWNFGYHGGHHGHSHWSFGLSSW